MKGYFKTLVIAAWAKEGTVTVDHFSNVYAGVRNNRNTMAIIKSTDYEEYHMFYRAVERAIKEACIVEEYYC